MSEPISAEFLALQTALAGRYSIERELGRGGMGVVLLARDVALDRLVAIKLLPADLAANAEYRERFLREARIAAGLAHPNIVPIHAVEEQGDLVFFVMGFVEGETLRERVERTGVVTPRAALKILQEVAWALAYAHDRGVVHRDIKPDNIMLDQATDRALVTDFGIAQRIEGEGNPGEIIGTARYMSPEQASGETVDARSDLYSLSATFFYALTGRPPISGSTVPAILARQVNSPAPALRDVREDVPVRLAEIIDAGLEKSADARIQSADEIARAVAEARGRDVRAPPLVRSFVRNAEITTMVVIAAAVAGQSFSIGGSVDVIVIGPGIVGMILIGQLVAVARRLLREGYTFDDIRAALLAEAEVQEEEARAVLKSQWLRKLDGFWHRLWAGKFGRWFFRMAGIRLEPSEHRVVPSTDATEHVLGRAVLDTFRALPASRQSDLPAVEPVVRRLEERAERLRDRGETGDDLAATVAALENIRIALLRLRTGTGSVGDLTAHLDRAREIGRGVDHVIEARGDVSPPG